MSDNAFLAPPKRRRRSLLVGAVGLVALGLAAGLTLHTAVGSDPSPAAAAPANPHGNPDADLPVGAVPTQTPSVRPGPIQIEPGSRVVNAIAVGYSHSTRGAVSAAFEYWTQLGSTLEPDRAATIGRICADPAWAQAPQQFAQGPVNSRRKFGLPATGSVPRGASMVSSLSAYQLRDVSADQVLVLLLGYLTATVPDKGIESRVVLYPALMTWADGDWKMAQRTDPNAFVELRVDPGSPAAINAGFQDLVR